MKRVLIVATYAPPLNCIASRRIENWVRYLPRFGFEPQVLTRYFDEDQCECYGEDPSLLEPKDLREDFVVRPPYLYTNFKARRGPDLIPSAKLRGLLHFLGPEPLQGGWLKYCDRALDSLEHPPDIVVASFGPPITLKVARRAARRFGVPWVVDYRDYWIYPDDARSEFKERLQRRHLSGVAGFITVTEGIETDLQRQIAPIKVPSTVVYNGIRTGPEGGGGEEEQQDGAPFAEVRRVRREYERIVMFVGTLHERLNIRFFLDEIAKFQGKRKDWCLLLLGRHEKEDFAEYPFVETVGPVTREVSRALQREVDALVFPTPVARESCFSGKIFEYVASGRPVWLGPTPSRDLVEFVSDVPQVRVLGSERELARELEMVEPVDRNSSQAAPAAPIPEKMRAETSVRKLAGFLQSIVQSAREEKKSEAAAGH